MECDCGGEISPDTVRVEVGKMSWLHNRFCTKCGKMFWRNAEPSLTSDGKANFLLKDGEKFMEPFRVQVQ